MPSNKDFYDALTNLSLSADSVNLNVDQVEGKLDTANGLLTTLSADTALIKSDVADGVSVDTGLTQPLTDAQLRAEAVTVEGTVTANTGLSQPLTNDQLRDDPVVISQSSASSLKGQAQLIDSGGTVYDYAQAGTAGSPSSDVMSIQGVENGEAVAIKDGGNVITVDGAVTSYSDKGYIQQTEENQTINDADEAQIIFSNDTSRRFLFIQNLSDTNMYVGLGFQPSTSPAFGILLPSGGGTLKFDSGYIPSNSVYIVCTASGKQFIALHATA